ncbi:MAG: nitrile hydratase accessory protein [Nocardioides sp.]
MTATPVELDIEGPAAPPRSNGELVFAAPWESRTFGMAMALADAGVFTWDDFRDALIARIGAWEANPPEGECYSYYSCWQGALEDVLAARELVASDTLADRGEELAARPAGYDHGHEGGHGSDDDEHGHGHGHGH